MTKIKACRSAFPLILIFIALSIIFSLFLYNMNEGKKLLFAQEQYINNIRKIFDKYGVTDADIIINYWSDEEYFNYSYPIITSDDYDDLSGSEKYNLFIDIDKATNSFNNDNYKYKGKGLRCFFKNIKNDRNIYTIETIENNGEKEETLMNHYTEVIYKKTNEKKEKSVSSMPYKGMSEGLLNNTPLGKADEIDVCNDFYLLKPSHRYKTYRWFKKGSSKKATDLICSATISYWDYKNKIEVSGYVSNITFFGEYSLYNK